MNTQIFQAILKSILLTTFFSTLVGGSVFFFTKNIKFAILGFIITTVFQFIFNYAIVYYTDKKYAYNIATDANSILENIKKKNSIDINCAYCHITNHINYFFNNTTTFKCPSCGQINAIKVEMYAVRLTTPVNDINLNEIEIDDKSVVVKDKSEPIEFKS